MSLGKTIRLKRVLNDPTNTSVICALDHGMTSPVFLEPLADIRARVTEAVAGGANVLMLSRGMSRIAAAELSQTTAVAYMLSASADPGENPSIAAVAEVEEALRSGADAVVLYVALGTDTEQDMIERLAEVGSACDELGMPFIAEAEWPSAYSGTTAELGTDYLLRNVRLCARARRRRHQDELARLGRGVRPPGRRRRRPPDRARRRLPDHRGRAAHPPAARDGGGRRRLQRRAEHLHAREPRGDDPRPEARDRRPVDG